MGSTEMWLSASASVLAISLCGVFGVMVVPIMQRVFYQHLIQFLVALAVGTLSGDALLHLLPHAILGGMDMGGDHAQIERFERNAIWRSFFALMAFLVFFLLERVINLLGEMRERRRRETRDKKVHIVRSGHKTSSKAVGEKQCKNKYSSYCVQDVDDAESIQALNNGGAGAAGGATTEGRAASLYAVESEDTGNGGGKDMVVFKGGRWNNKRKSEPAGAAKCSPAGEDPGNGAAPSQEGETAAENENEEESALTVAGATTVTTDPGTYDTVFVREHENSHHGHSHAHSHIHSKPDSISSVGGFPTFSLLPLCSQV